MKFFNGWQFQIRKNAQKWDLMDQGMWNGFIEDH